jgi:hypothetical protein
MINYDVYKLLNYTVSAIIDYIVTGPNTLLYLWLTVVYCYIPRQYFLFGLHKSSADKQDKIDVIDFSFCKQTCKMDIMLRPTLRHSPKICFNFKSTISKFKKGDFFWILTFSSGNCYWRIYACAISYFVYVRELSNIFCHNNRYIKLRCIQEPFELQSYKDTISLVPLNSC